MDQIIAVDITDAILTDEQFKSIIDLTFRVSDMNTSIRVRLPCPLSPREIYNAPLAEVFAAMGIDTIFHVTWKGKQK